ncbi:MAG: methyltransferase domain-containing protein [Magnetococcales bacterium]|nr:methyltransferase domain-containing protein [Magnetococcales bacterium]
MKPSYSEVVETSRTYYNSSDADTFYRLLWGGEDIHIGIFENPQEEVRTASRRTVETMANHMEGYLKPEHKVLDLGGGYCGAARYLATRFKCQVTSLNLSDVQNTYARELNRAQKLDHLVEAVEGSFEAIPFADNSYDLIWSQDAILHSSERAKVIAEAARVLKPGGFFILSDIMQTQGTPKELLEPVLNRIHLDSLGSYPFYKKTTNEFGLKEIFMEDLSKNLQLHYQKIHQKMVENQSNLQDKISQTYLNNMGIGLNHWIDAGKSGYLQWGIMKFQA